MMRRSSLLEPYQPLPWQIKPWRDRSPVMLLGGAAGGGKSRLAAEKVHAYLLKYRNATGLVVRKTRESLTSSTVLFLSRTVIGRDPRVKHIKTEHCFKYSNGSVLIYGGMKDDEQREQIRGVGVKAGVDIAWMEEAVKFTENDYNEVTGRMRGPAAPWRQIILSTNPGPPSHWIHQRLMIGREARVFQSRPEDNPYNPADYINSLRRLTGILRQRLYEGRWVQAEGLVYESFDLDNLTDDGPDLALPIEVAFDEGYIDPRAILLIQRRGHEILVFDEIYHSQHLAETCVRELVELVAGYYGQTVPDDLRRRPLEELAAWCARRDEKTGEELMRLPEIAIGSPEAKEMQQRLRLANIPYRSRPHEVVEGIKVVRELICDGNGYRTLRVNRKCANFVKELTELYQYPEPGSRRDSEKPQDGNDHACDAFRYWAWVRARSLNR